MAEVQPAAVQSSNPNQKHYSWLGGIPIATIAVWLVLSWVFGSIFGRWQAPAWLAWVGRKIAAVWRWLTGFVATHKKQSAIAAVALVAASAGGYAGYDWYQKQPKPVYVKHEATNPSKSDYASVDWKPQPATIKFNGSVAPLELVNKPITTGITLSPVIEGQWVWTDDRTLKFTPKTDWGVDTEYAVSFAKEGFFTPKVKIEKLTATFKSAPFTAQFSQAQFYQDPVDPAGKKTVATVRFSHPIDAADFEKHVSLERVAKEKKGVLESITGSTNQLKFKVTFDKERLNAYIHSELLTLQDEPQNILMQISEGVKSTVSVHGGKSTPAFKKSIEIPSLMGLKIDQPKLAVASNEKEIPETVLLVHSSAAINEKTFAENVSAWLLPEFYTDPTEAAADGDDAAKKKTPFNWANFNVAKLGPEILKANQKLQLTSIPNEIENTQDMGFKLKAKPGRYVYVKVNAGLTSFGGLKLAKPQEVIARSPQYPPMLRVMSEGSLLALSGEKRLPVVSREISGIQFEIGRVIPSQLQQLVVRHLKNADNMSKPEIDKGSDENFLVERFNDIVPVTPETGKNQYTSLDLAKYLDAGGTAQKRGVFLLRVNGYNIEAKRKQGPSDSRLVVVTDLGIIIKKNLDQANDVFVQSIFTGTAVEGATIEVLGQNGLPVATATTSAQGHAKLQSLKDFTREKTPAVLLVKKGNDLSFLPLNRRDRTLDLSRFEIGGIANTADKSRISGYMFSDRGIYRPGEEIRLGAIFKTADWKALPEGLPLQFEMTDPRGLAVEKQIIKLTAGGFEAFTHRLSTTAATGQYAVSVNILKEAEQPATDDKDKAAKKTPPKLIVDTQIAATTIKVQDFQPDRLKMTAQFSASKTEGWVAPQDLKVRVNVQNLFGTSAENRRVTANISLRPSAPYFPSHEGYTFTDPEYAKEGFSEPLPDKTSDEKGEAEFELNLQRFARATYRANLVAQAFEPDGGRGVAAEATTIVSHLQYLIGYKADGDLNYIARGGKRNVALLAINSDAKPFAVENLTLSRFERRFVSVLTKQSDGTYRYDSKERQVLKTQVPLKLAAKNYALALDTETAGSYTYIVTDAAGVEYAKIRYQVAGTANLTRSLERDAELKLTLSKPDYAAGEMVEVQVQAPYIGAGLITIEREQVFTHAWFKTDKTTSIQKIKLPDGIEGNAYVNVTFVRDPASPEVFMSPLSYGAVPFSINLDKRREPVTLTSPPLVKPGDNVPFEIKTAKPSRAVVFAIDEGILQVARYKKPDAVEHFFQKRKLDVTNSQILDLVLPEFSRVMAAAPGGDAEGALGKHLNPFKKRRDLAIAYWSGIVDVGPDGKTLNWQVPDRFNGSLKVFAVVVNGQSIGVKEVQTTVRGDIVLTPNVPAVAAPGDEIEVSVGVANQIKGSGKDATITVSLAPVPQFTIMGEATQKVKVAEGREGIAYFRLKGTDKLGEGNLVFSASGAAGTVTKSAKLTEYVSVRPATPYQHTMNAGVLKAGQSIDIALSRDMHSELRKMNASVSYLPLGLTGGLTAYLDSYAYSCTEQLISKALPTLVISGRPEFGKVSVAPSANTPTTNSVAKVSTTTTPEPQDSAAAGTVSTNEAIKILRARQTPEGSYGLWASNHHVDVEASLYAQLFLIEAAERKQAVPPDLIKNGNKYLRALAEGGGGKSLSDERERAIAVYLLTRQGQVTSTWVADVHRTLEAKYAKAWKRDIVAMYISATYALLKQEKLSNDAKRDFPLTGKFTYSGMHSSTTRSGQGIYLIAKHFPSELSKVNEAVYLELIEPLTKNQTTTYGSGWLLLAFDAIASTDNAKASTETLAIAELDKKGVAKPRALPAMLVPKVDVTGGTAKVRFENKGSIPAFYVVNQSGYDRAGTATQVVDNGLEIIREYVDKAGKPITDVKVGDEIDVKLTFRTIGSRASVSDAAIVDLLPAGFEWVPAVKTTANEDQAAINTGNANPCPPARREEDANASEEDATPRNEDEQPSEGNPECTPEGEEAPEQPKVAWQPPIGVPGTGTNAWSPQFADARDDRIVLYGEVSTTAQSFTYRIKATNKGKFTTPPAYAESMYDRTIKARSKVGAAIEVKGR